jgi:hypothetical protein
MELSPIFDIKLNEILALRKWFKECPRQLQRATAVILNNYAFGTREMILRTLPEIMTIRNSGLPRKATWADKAKYSDRIEDQKSHVGTRTAGMKRFTGWVEQESGQKATRTRLQTLAARGGSKENVVEQRNRLKPATPVLTIAQYNPRGGLMNYQGFAAMIRRKKYMGLYRIKDRVYRDGKTVQKLHPTSGLQPRKNPFLLFSAGRYHKSIDLSAMWYRTVQMVLKPPPRG